MGIFDKIRGISPEERKNLENIKKGAYYGTRNKLDRERKERKAEKEAAKKMKRLEAQQKRAEKAAETGKKLAEIGRVKKTSTERTYPEKVDAKTKAMAKKAGTKTKRPSDIKSKVNSWADRKAAQMKAGELDNPWGMSFGNVPATPTTKRKTRTKK